MKIAFLNLYAGSVQRGAETFTEALAKRITREHEVEWYKGYSEALPLHQFPKNILRSLQKHCFLDRANRAVLRFSLKTLSSLRQGNFDVVVPMNGFWQVLLVKLLQPFKKYQILIIGHAGPGWDERFNLYLHPDVFVATTQPAYEWAKHTCPWTRMELVPYAVSETKFKAAKPVKIPLKKPIILCPAALVPYKRIELAIEAVARLKSASLLILGQGPLEEKLQKLGKEKLANRWLLTSVSHDRIPDYYATADLVTLPSLLQENSPMVFLESLAAGKLVVTTDTQRNRWMLEKAGIYCDPMNLKEYTNALALGLQRKDEARTKTAAISALVKFQWATVEKSYQRILTSLNHH